MMFNFSDLTKYQFIGEYSGVRLYMPVDIVSGYHLSRYVELTRQEIYASSGVTSEVLKASLGGILDICDMNGERERKFTDISLIVQALMYRLEHPIDDIASIRIGCVLCFCEYEEGGVLVQEDPSRIDVVTMNKKVSIAMSDPDAYVFFLHMGIRYQKKSEEVLNISELINYLTEREEVLRSLGGVKKG